MKLDWCFYKQGATGPHVFLRNDGASVLIGHRTDDGKASTRIDHAWQIRRIGEILIEFADSLHEDFEKANANTPPG